MLFHVRKFDEREKEERGAKKHDKIFRNNFYHENVKKNKLKMILTSRLEALNEIMIV